MDINKDKRGGRACTHKNSLKEVKGICETWDVLDIWRILNQEEERFTWRRKKPDIQCRLDFFLISQSLISKINTSDIVPGYKTDHSMITMAIVTNSNPRGPGFWKLNTSFLSEDNYVTKIQNTIQDTKSEYANNPSVSPALLWEMIKLKIREASLLYAKQKKKERADQADKLEKIINNLERTLEDKSIERQLREQLLDALKSKRQQYEMIIEYRTKGAILRSQCRWYNESEKNTKYFLNLEKTHYKQGLTDGQDPSINQFFFPEVGDVHLSKAEEMSCEGPLIETECLSSLKQMTDSKTPGTDGLPAEFYKLFWSDFSDVLISALNFAYDTGKLPITQRRGLIKLIPKKETDLKNLKNWRPLSLLNCDYKIAAKSIQIESKLLSRNSSTMTRQDLSKAGLLVKIYV